MLIRNKNFDLHNYYNKFINYIKNTVNNRNILNNITLFTVNFNNMYMTCRMLESFFYNCDFNIPFYIVDNSTINEKNVDLIYNNFNIIDNKNFKILNDLNDISKNHSLTIDYILYNVIKTDYVILCDNDVIFKSELNNILKEYMEYDTIGTIEDGYVPPLRITPVFCIINLKKLKADKIKYYIENKCKVSITPFKKTTFLYGQNYEIPVEYYYDTGSAFYEQIVEKNWNIKNINPNNYYEHFDGLGHINKLLEDTYFIKRKYYSISDFLEKNSKYILLK